jgi:7,8-dihydropterin-6-yl-methyl-4-(beta-D-ribofuranosyl)aminobenzene 5'-phosphate synthase
MTFTIVYDNNAYDPALRTSWGFSCWVETDEATVLFDSGGDGATLIHNLKGLGLDPQEIDAVVLSHAHGDHTGGLGAVLATGVRPTVYVPASFSESFKKDVRARTKLVEVSESMVVAPGIHTTGEVKSNVVEQALAVETDEGLVVVTGCAHPGIVDMVHCAKEVADGEVILVMGGFHLGGASQGRIERIIGDLRGLGVKRVAPCHCTGDKARQAFVDAFGDDADLAGVGWSTEFVSGR